MNPTLALNGSSLTVVPRAPENGADTAAHIQSMRGDFETWSQLPTKEDIEGTLRSIGSLVDQLVFSLLQERSANLRTALTERLLNGIETDDALSERQALLSILEDELRQNPGVQSLFSQVRSAFAYDAKRSGGDLDAGQAGLQAMQGLATKLPVILIKLAEDVEAAYKGDPAAKGPEEIIAAYPGYAVGKTYRIAHALHGLHVPYVPRMMTEQAHGAYGADIHPGATIGRRFFIDHATKVVIGETAEIGDDVKLYHGVTLGAVSLADAEGLRQSGAKRHPTVGDRVVIYSDATVLGGQTHIGAGSVIGAGARLVNMRTGTDTEFGANATGFGSTIGDGSRIKSNTNVSYSTIGAGNDIGPNATVLNADTANGVRIEANAGVHGQRSRRVRVGEGAHIGENVAVTRDVSAGAVLHARGAFDRILGATLERLRSVLRPTSAETSATRDPQ